MDLDICMRGQCARERKKDTRALMRAHTHTLLSLRERERERERERGREREEERERDGGMDG